MKRHMGLIAALALVAVMSSPKNSCPTVATSEVVMS
jgi:hypothetical protein